MDGSRDGARPRTAASEGVEQIHSGRTSRARTVGARAETRSNARCGRRSLANLRIDRGPDLTACRRSCRRSWHDGSTGRRKGQGQIRIAFASLDSCKPDRAAAPVPAAAQLARSGDRLRTSARSRSRLASMTAAVDFRRFGETARTDGQPGSLRQVQAAPSGLCATGSVMFRVVAVQFLTSLLVRREPG